MNISATCLFLFDSVNSRFLTADDNGLRLPESPSALLVSFAICAVLLHQILLYFHLRLRYPPRRPWAYWINMVSSKIASLLDQSYGSLNRTLSSGLEGEIGKSGMTRSRGLKSVLGFDATRYLPRAYSGGSGGGLGERSNTSITDHPPGLGNWDNSCYQNSVIQGLASLRSVPPYLHSILPDKSHELERSDSSMPTTAALRGTIDDLNNPNNGGRLLWIPSALKSMSSWQQQDAQEYFSKILDELDKEVRGTVAREGNQDNPGLRITSDSEPATEGFDGGKLTASLLINSEQCLQAGKDVYSNVLRPLLTGRWPHHNPLEGFLAQRVGCLQCGWSEELSMIPFICLTVPLGRGWTFDLESCLDEYTKLEYIEGVECAKCTLSRSKERLESLLATAEQEALSGDHHPSLPSIAEALQSTVTTRLKAVNMALDDEDYSETTLVNKCKLTVRNRVTTTKSRQAVIARAPKSLVIHINRSVFDEYTGAQRKNYAEVRFPKTLDLSRWCLNVNTGKDPGSSEDRMLDPAQSLLAGAQGKPSGPLYKIRAAVTHYGRHENGHYICYREYPYPEEPHTSIGNTKAEDHRDEASTQRWWRLSDDEVTAVSEEEVLDQGGVFMLFYDRVDTKPVNDEFFSKVEGSSEVGITTLQADPPRTHILALSSDRPLSSLSHQDEDDSSPTQTINDPTKENTGEEICLQTSSTTTAEQSDATSPDNTGLNEPQQEEERRASNPPPEGPLTSARPARVGYSSGVEMMERDHMGSSSISSSLVLAN